MYFLLVFFFSNGYALGYDKFYFIPQLDDTHVDDTMITVYKLDTCFLWNESVSCKYVYKDDTHVEMKEYFDNTKCEENFYVKSKIEEVNTYLTHLQDQIDQSYVYYVNYLSTECNQPYSYTFYKEEHCNIYADVRNYVEINDNELFVYIYMVDLGKDLKCTFDDEILYSRPQIIKNNKCLKNGDYPWEGLEWKINSEKQKRCENATDEIGILFAFVFLMLILI